MSRVQSDGDEADQHDSISSTTAILGVTKHWLTISCPNLRTQTTTANHLSARSNPCASSERFMKRSTGSSLLGLIAPLNVCGASCTANTTRYVN